MELQAFAVNPSRILFPHFGVIFDLLQCCGCCRAFSSITILPLVQLFFTLSPQSLSLTTPVAESSSFF
jgi:hypothetical protein